MFKRSSIRQTPPPPFPNELLHLLSSFEELPKMFVVKIGQSLLEKTGVDLSSLGTWIPLRGKMFFPKTSFDEKGNVLGEGIAPSRISNKIEKLKDPFFSFEEALQKIIKDKHFNGLAVLLQADKPSIFNNPSFFCFNLDWLLLCFQESQSNGSFDC